MQFVPYVINREGSRVNAAIVPMTAEDAAATDRIPQWQTSWTSDYLSVSSFEKYAAKAGEELIALAAYEIRKETLVVHIVYMEAQPDSNPVMDQDIPRYTGIGQLMIAYGIKLSIDNGFAGDVVLEAKTTALAKHYEEDFGAVALPVFEASAPRYLIADEPAKRIFFRYLE